MPPAFNLSQDQTLQFKALSFTKERNPHSELLRIQVGSYADFAFQAPAQAPTQII
jgi:hypothetical protein